MADDLKGNKDALVAAVIEWWGERAPSDPGDARLMQALWRYDGDHTEPCPECDGECGEPCAPCTVENAVAYLDNWIEQYNERHGIRAILAANAEAS